MNRFTMFLVALLALVVPASAGATVKKEGTWPAAEKKVSFDFDGAPSEGLKQLAKEAGWSLVVSKGIAIGEHDVEIDVDDQPADKVLEALFASGNVIATRDGDLITVTPANGASTVPVPPVPPVPAAAPAAPVAPGAPAPLPTVRGEDRSIMGSNLVIEKDEVVHDVQVTGGNVTVRGTVMGDLMVTGGSATVESTGHVVGDVAMLGGSVHLKNGARVDGDVATVGGSMTREEGSIVGGKVSKGHGKAKASKEIDLGGERSHGKLHEIGQTITKMALLYVFGCVLLALLTRRMDTLRIEVAARPMRSFALGVVASVVALLALVALCITVIGIPFAIVMVIAGIFATYGAIAAVLTTFGAAVAGHKSKSPYVHLLVGCAAFLVLLPIPFLGGLAAFVVTMVAMGTLVSTRLGNGTKLRPPALV